MGNFAVGSYVNSGDQKYSIQGYRKDGRAIMESADGSMRYAHDHDLRAWTDATVRLNVRRFFNVYEGDRVGHLVREQTKADRNVRNSHRKRIGIVELTLVTEGNGNIRTEQKFTKIND